MTNLEQALNDLEFVLSGNTLELPLDGYVTGFEVVDTIDENCIADLTIKSTNEDQRNRLLDMIELLREGAAQ